VKEGSLGGRRVPWWKKGPLMEEGSLGGRAGKVRRHGAGLCQHTATGPGCHSCCALGGGASMRIPSNRMALLTLKYHCTYIIDRTWVGFVDQRRGIRQRHNDDIVCKLNQPLSVPMLFIHEAEQLSDQGCVERFVLAVRLLALSRHLTVSRQGAVWWLCQTSPLPFGDQTRSPAEVIPRQLI